MASEKSVVIYNRGIRTFHFPPLAKGGEKRVLGPGGQLEVSAKEAAKLTGPTGYKDLIEFSARMGKDRTAQLEKENAKLREQLAAMQEEKSAAAKAKDKAKGDGEGDEGKDKK